MKKMRRKFKESEKRRAVEDYVSGRRSAQEIAAELGVDVQYIYNWRVRFDELAKGEKVAHFESIGADPTTARILAEKDAEIEAYKARVGELSLHVELLKKAHPAFQHSRNMSGYAEIARVLKPSKKRAK